MQRSHNGWSHPLDKRLPRKPYGERFKRGEVDMSVPKKRHKKKQRQRDRKLERDDVR